MPKFHQGSSSSNADTESEAFATVKIQLKEVSQRLAKNREGLSAEVIAQFAAQISELTPTIFAAEHYSRATMQASGSVLGTRNRGEEESSAPDLKRLIMQQAEDLHSSYDPSKDPRVREITSILSAGGDMGDEDLVAMDKGLTERDTKCPYTSKTFVDPMRNNGASGGKACIHHISRTGLDAMFNSSRANAVNCPQSGCAGKWTKGGSELDTVFDRSVKRLLREIEIETQAHGGGASSKAMAVDDYEEGTYTQL